MGQPDSISRNEFSKIEKRGKRKFRRHIVDKAENIMRRFKKKSICRNYISVKEDIIRLKELEQEVIDADEKIL